MSINHNRIKVADLEKNSPNKILVTNSDGELEFSETYNITLNSSAFLWRVGRSTADHFHIVSLTVENARKLVEGEVTQVLVESNSVNEHTHEITIEFDSERNLFFITDISNNVEDNHVIFPLTNIEVFGGSGSHLQQVLNNGSYAFIGGEYYSTDIYIGDPNRVVEIHSRDIDDNLRSDFSFNPYSVNISTSHYTPDLFSQYGSTLDMDNGKIRVSQSFNSTAGSNQTDLVFNTPVSQSSLGLPSPLSSSQRTLTISVNGSFADENGNIEISLDTDLVNDLTTGGTIKALTAEMGKNLKVLIDDLEISKFNITEISQNIEEDKLSVNKTASVKEIYDFAIKKSTTYTPINNLISLTKLQYDNLIEKDSTTLYFIQ